MPLVLILVCPRCLLYCQLSSSSSSGVVSLSPGPMRKSLLNIPEEWWGHHHRQCHHCCCWHGRSHLRHLWDTSKTPLRRPPQTISKLSRTLEAPLNGPEGSSERYVTQSPSSLLSSFSFWTTFTGWPLVLLATSSTGIADASYCQQVPSHPFSLKHVLA